MSTRNNLVEFERFIYSILVVGYHIQSTFLRNADSNFFENGLNAVEFFFLVSGYFMARSIEKISSKENPSVFNETFNFMKNKIKSILPVHIVSNIIMIIYIIIKPITTTKEMLINGLPSFFLVQMIVVWNNSYLQAYNIPEWYISTMLLCMLILVPISLLLRKKMSLFFVTLIPFSFMCIVYIIVGFCTKWKVPDNFFFDARGWLELCSGMFAFCFSNYIKNFNSSVWLKIIEIFCYNAPIVLGFAPISNKYVNFILASTALFVFVGLSITFAGKGVVIKNEKLNAFFGYLGVISLPIYLFHAAVIFYLMSLGNKFNIWAIYLIFISITILVSVIYKLIYDLIIMIINKIKNRKKENVPYQSLA